MNYSNTERILRSTTMCSNVRRYVECPYLTIGRLAQLLPSFYFILSVNLRIVFQMVQARSAKVVTKHITYIVCCGYVPNLDHQFH